MHRVSKRTALLRVAIGLACVATVLIAGAVISRMNSNGSRLPEAPVPLTQEPQRDAGLENMLNDWTAEQPGRFSIVVRELSGSKRYAAYRADEKLIPASTYKLFLTYAVLSAAEAGRLDLDTPVDDGTVGTCIESILVLSSDECIFTLGNLIGWAEIDDFLHAKGFHDTIINNYDATGGFIDEKYSSAENLAELLWRLQNYKLLNASHTDRMLSFMKRQVHRERIAAGVPQNVEVASKPGWVFTIENDAGIVYGPKATYVVVIMSDGSSAKVAADLSGQIYTYLNK